MVESIKASTKAKAESLKSMIDAVTSEKIEQVNEIEETLLPRNLQFISCIRKVSSCLFYSQNRKE